MPGDYNWTLLKLFSSLTNRIFVASALLAVVSIALGIYNVNVAVSTQAENELLRGLAEARTLIEENRREQVEHFTREARLIADLPKLKAAVGEADSATAGGVVEGYQQRALGRSLHGDRPSWPGAGVAAPGAGPEVHRARRAAVGREAGGRRQGDPLVCRPSRRHSPDGVGPDLDHAGPDAPEILGTLNIGFSLNWHVADRFRALTNSDVAFGVERSHPGFYAAP